MKTKDGRTYLALALLGVLVAVFFLFKTINLPDSLPPSSQLAAVSSAPPWYINIEPAITDTNDNQGDSGYSRWAAVTVPTGTASRVAVYLQSVNAVGYTIAFKAALYTSGGVLVGSGSGTVSSGDSQSWKEIDIGSVAVTAGTYYISWTAQANSSDVVYHNRSGSGQTFLADSPSYANFPASTLPTSRQFQVLGATPVAAYVTDGSASAPVSTPTPPSTPVQNPSQTPVSTPPASIPTNGTLTLTVVKVGNGTGTVTGGSIACGSMCTQTNIPYGTNITLSATAATDTYFAEWSGAGCQWNATCSITMAGDTTVYVGFAKRFANAGELIPSVRLIDWTPGSTVGVTNGIPLTRAKCVTTECQALENASAGYKDGTSDATTLIQSAVNSAVPSTYVLIPAGRFRVSTITLGPTRDSITLRGGGIDTTTLDCRSNNCIMVGSGSDYNWSWPSTGNTITAGLSKGSTNISISDTSQFAVGQMAQIVVANDYSIPVVSGFQNARRQMVRITGKTGSSLAFYPPLYAHYSGQTAAIHVAQMQTDFAGIEDLTVDGANATMTFGIQFEQTYSSWVRNVRVVRASNYDVFMQDSVNCEMRHSRLDDLNHGGSNGAGLLFNTNSACLIEDNIIHESFPNVEINHGASGNVFAYNFLNNSNGLMGFDTNHGPHNQYNLFEGNIVHSIMSDGYFGSESDTTLFRNWITGAYLSSANVPSPTFCITLKRFARDFSIVGNQIGSSAASSGSSCVNFGQPNIGNGSWEGFAQPSAGVYWKDFGSSGSTIRGALTVRADNLHGTLTLTSGTLIPYQAPVLRWGANSYATVQVSSVVGNTVIVDATPFGATLPAANVALDIWPGAGGMQERDLDVAATTLMRGNWESFMNGVPAYAPLGGFTLPNSLYLSARPWWFGSLSWPPFNPQNPAQSYDAIPAGYRYMHNNAEAPGVTGYVPSGTPPPPSTTPASSQASAPPVSQPVTATSTTAAAVAVTTSVAAGSSSGGGGGGGGTVSVNSAPLCAKGAVTVFSRQLVLGSGGEDVRSLQKLLNAKGFIVSVSGPGSKGAETAYYGAATTAAMKRMQAANGLSATGSLDAASLRTANLLAGQLACGAGVSASPTAPASTGAFTGNLSMGAKGSDVSRLQTYLAAQPGLYPEKLVTGTYGALTQAAVGRFQILYGIAKPGDGGYGSFGPITRAKLNTLMR